MTYNVFGGTLNLAQSIAQFTFTFTFVNGARIADTPHRRRMNLSLFERTSIRPPPSHDQ